MVQKESIIVRNVVKFYEAEKPVLANVNMTVSEGTIYGLLGPSGCGKSTLLSCIVGIRHFNSGKLRVLGENPGDKNSGIPGSRVGYMPQETALVDEFTRSNALYYFGRINGLEDDEIETRQEFLSELLELPPKDHLVRNMSGGQQRTVSFAAALIHRPELLILDEPTVSLDPILREKIWNHLIEITQQENITVVITTHYVEEAKAADKVGFMRCGELLAESSPQQLLERFQCESLEETFLMLIQMQNNNIANTNMSTVQECKVENVENDVFSRKRNERKDKNLKYNGSPKQRVSPRKRVKALMVKNSIQFLRYYSGIVFTVLFPIIHVSSFLIGFGGDPKGLTIGVINDEISNCDYNRSFSKVWYDDEKFTCNFGNLSCKFLQNFDDSIAVKKYYDEFSEALANVHQGKIVGVIHFSRNFSEVLQKRLKNIDIEETDIVANEIQVSLDMSDKHIGNFIHNKIYDNFFDTYKDVVKNCNLPSNYANLPVRFETPIYGTMDSQYIEFATPVFLITFAFFLGTSISITLIISDRAKGVWNRSLVQGVTIGELLLAYVLTQSIIVMIHTMISLCTCFIWGIEYKGSIFNIILFIFFSGSCGLMCGLFLSIMCKNYTDAHAISSGIFMITISLAGMLKPLEGMPKLLRWISLTTPVTLPSISLRNIINKGYSMYEPEVYSGFFVIIGWILFIFSLCLISLRIKSL